MHELLCAYMGCSMNTVHPYEQLSMRSLIDQPAGKNRWSKICHGTNMRFLKGISKTQNKSNTAHTH